MSTQYKVFFTTRLTVDTYGDEFDVSDYVKIKGLGSIKKSIDGSDYSFGAFTYSDFKITCVNETGKFNGPEDSRSFFPYSRDLTKVRIVFFQEVDQETVTFRGLIIDEASRVILKDDQIEFRILSRDSIMKKTSIPAGTVGNSIAISEAIYLILNLDQVRNILTIDTSNIAVTADGTVDVGSEFDNKTVRDALNELLIASNSIMFVNEDDEVVVRSRDADTSKEPLLLYGPGDLRSRTNILAVNNYNNGLQRIFNSITLNGTNVQDIESMLAFGARPKEIDYSWLTDSTNIEELAAAILNEFKYPKIELEVDIPTTIAKEYTLLDRVTVDYPLKAFPTSQFLPICGAFACGSELHKTPIVRGSISIAPTIGFKIIEITEDPKSFKSTLKLRQVGTEVDDGMF